MKVFASFFLFLLFQGSLLGASAWSDNIFITDTGVLSPSRVYGNQIKYTNIYTGNLGTGNVDLYTVPTGLRAMVSRLVCSTTNASGSTVYWTSKTNGVYYRLSANAALTQASATDVGGNLFIYEGGETVAISNTAAGVNAFLGFYLYTNTIPAMTKRVYALATGDNTLYTVANSTGNEVAWTVFPTGQPSIHPPIYVINASGGARTFNFYTVPNGGAVSTTNRLALVGSVSDLTLTQRTPPMLRAGDSVVVNSDDGTSPQTAWITIFEQ